MGRRRGLSGAPPVLRGQGSLVSQRLGPTGIQSIRTKQLRVSLAQGTGAERQGGRSRLGGQRGRLFLIYFSLRFWKC